MLHVPIVSQILKPKQSPSVPKKTSKLSLDIKVYPYLENFEKLFYEQKEGVLNLYTKSPKHILTAGKTRVRNNRKILLVLIYYNSR